MVAYRCSCGVEFSVSMENGGVCPKCTRKVSAQALQNDHLSVTTTLSSLQGDRLGQTRPDHESRTAKSKDMVGRSLGHFELLEPLGQGGQGYVYRGLDKSLQRYVAVKVLQQSATERVVTDDVDRLLQEAVSQARVTHPNIVTIYYVGKESGEPFLAMELVAGRAASELIENGPIDFRRTVRTASQLTKALQFSYDLDIIHGDIKPSNVMIQEDGTVKLSDFGMARRVSEREASAIGGTPNYLAPEILAGQAPSMQSDMYAMGVMLYEMTFGRLPVLLSGRSVDDWLTTHRQTEIEFPSPWPDNVPERWQEVLARLLAKSPQDRYENYTDLKRDLDLVSPTKSLIARRAPRLIAAAIDILSVILFMLPLQLLISGEIGGVSVRLGEYLESRPVMAFLLYVLDVVPIVVYTMTIFFWRHSIGRALMQIRVVNRYGLKPYRARMVSRSILRMSFVWMLIASFWTRGLSNKFGVAVVMIPALAFGAFSIINLIYLMFSRYSETLHDRLYKTSVVIDTDE